jgi:hypothetical protein
MQALYSISTSRSERPEGYRRWQYKQQVCHFGSIRASLSTQHPQNIAGREMAFPQWEVSG